jgi:gas vesicle protein
VSIPFPNKAHSTAPLLITGIPTASIRIQILCFLTGANLQKDRFSPESSNQCRESPLHIKQRNKESPRANQNVQKTLKKFQDNKNREYEKAKEKIKETIEALYKQQSETENTMNKHINELRTKIDNIKEETTQDMENLRKKIETELQSKTEGQPSRIEQTEDRI